MAQRIADQLTEILATHGVKRIYGVCGDSLNGITDSVRSRKDMVWALVRNEEAGAFAAGAEAHLTQNLAVCAGSCGPGNLHLINGLYDCHRSRVPVLAIAAQISQPDIGTSYFQETDPKHLFAQCSFFCEQVSAPEQMPRLLHIAIRTALAKRGVSVLVLPGPMALEHSQDNAAFSTPEWSAPEMRPATSDLHRAAEVIRGAEKVTVFAGAGCAGAHEELLAFAERAQAPIVHTLRGKEFVEPNNPYDVGMTGLLGFASGYQALKDCDTVVLAGTDFPYLQFYPSHAKTVQIDLRGSHIGRRTKVDAPVVGDCRSALADLTDIVLENRGDRHLNNCLGQYRETRADLDNLAVPHEGSEIIHPQTLTKAIDRIADPDAIFTVDTGTPTVWAARYLTMNGHRRLLGSFLHGSMANALPQAIGAQASHPGRQVVALCGDGGLSMLMGELATLRQLDLPVKIVVFRNGSLAFVELEMMAAGFLDYATSLENPDFSMVASACGILSFRVDTLDQMDEALTQALRHHGPALVDVRVARQEISMPPTIMPEQVKGFGIFMLKAVFSGRGTELVDLAKTNVIR